MNTPGHISRNLTRRTPIRILGRVPGRILGECAAEECAVGVSGEIPRGGNL